MAWTCQNNSHTLQNTAISSSLCVQVLFFNTKAKMFWLGRSARELASSYFAKPGIAGKNSLKTAVSGWRSMHTNLQESGSKHINSIFYLFISFLWYATTFSSINDERPTTNIDFSRTFQGRIISLRIFLLLSLLSSSFATELFTSLIEDDYKTEFPATNFYQEVDFQMCL